MFSWLKSFCSFETCDLCCEETWDMSYCPYFRGHKWCNDCDAHLYKCPFCRQEFLKEHIMIHTLFLETIVVNKPIHKLNSST